MSGGRKGHLGGHCNHLVNQADFCRDLEEIKNRYTRGIEIEDEVVILLGQFCN